MHPSLLRSSDRVLPAHSRRSRIRLSITESPTIIFPNPIHSNRSVAADVLLRQEPDEEEDDEDEQDDDDEKDDEGYSE